MGRSLQEGDLAAGLLRRRNTMFVLMLYSVFDCVCVDPQLCMQVLITVVINYCKCSL